MLCFIKSYEMCCIYFAFATVLTSVFLLKGGAKSDRDLLEKLNQMRTAKETVDQKYL